MMLDFMLKYTWIGMLVLVYVIWGIVSIKDIIETMRRYHYSLRVALDNLKEPTVVWFLVSTGLLFLMSFIYFLLSIGGEG